MERALFLSAGDSLPMDVSSVHHNSTLLRYSVSLLGYGFYGDIIKDSERKRWMGLIRYDFSGNSGNARTPCAHPTPCTAPVSTDRRPAPCFLRPQVLVGQVRGARRAGPAALATDPCSVLAAGLELVGTGNGCRLRGTGTVCSRQALSPSDRSLTVQSLVGTSAARTCSFAEFEQCPIGGPCPFQFAFGRIY